MDYYIESFDLYGNPEKYILLVRDDSYGRGLQQVKVDASRILRLWGENIEYRYQGYSSLASVYDSITIMGTILKGTGEAAFRWGTGHPVIFTKDIFTEGDMQFLRDKIGDFTREDWHVLPNEFVESIEMLGQAGSMLNFKALADIAIEQVIIGTGFPRSILLGESAGVTGGEVNERSYFAMLDADHTEYEPFIKRFFEKSPQIRNLLSDVDFYELDWGVREVMNKKEQVEYEQKQISNALALTQICTIDECR
jgi:hypothetical protein